jgi:hypothetical protein
LVLSNSSLSELVKIVEKLLNANALHDNMGTNTVFNVARVTAEVNTGLHKSVGNNIDFCGLISEES